MDLDLADHRRVLYNPMLSALIGDETHRKVSCSKVAADNIPHCLCRRPHLFHRGGGQDHQCDDGAAEK